MDSVVGLLVTSKRVYAKGDLPRLLLPVLPSLWWAPANPHLHRRPFNTSRWFWFSILWSQCSFPPSLCAHKVLFVPSKTGVSVSPSLWKSCSQILLAFKVRFAGNQFLCQIPRLGSLTWDSEPSQQWENFFGIILWVTHFLEMGFDFIMIVPLLLSFCSFFVFGHGVSLW